ncbi:MAG TPA: diacylglycerol kinase family protein [Planctomycetaceae bacterium]|nr:diacylglycerol kinase family protein [Planctomycetaceae bacterium]HQZ65094.1 diacylglycerol kinase family protein [Planctomycetaceae bacterium]
MKYVAVLNEEGGTLLTMNVDEFASEVARVFEEAGHTIQVLRTDNQHLIQTLELAASDADAILVAGGDGTVSAASTVVIRSKVALAVLPAGTMNLFARSLSIPLDLNSAMTALANGRIAKVDVGWANDRSFIHQFSVGMHPSLLRHRKRIDYKSRLGKLFASIRAALSAIRRPLVFEADIQTPAGNTRRRVSGIFVSNNPFEEGHLPYAPELNAGMLGLYIALPMTTLQWLKLCIAVMIGRWKSNSFISESSVKSLTLTFPRRRKHNFAALDGELIELETTVRLRIDSAAMHVVVPQH